MSSLRFWSIPLILFAASLCAYLGMVSMQLRHGSLGGAVVFEFLAWFGLAFVTYAAAIFWLERWWRSDRRTRAWRPSRSARILSRGGALAGRLPLPLAPAADLSDAFIGCLPLYLGRSCLCERHQPV